MGVGWKRRSAAISRHTTQEIEANRFAIELLAPPDLMRPYLRGIPDLAKVLSLARALDLSREPCAAESFSACLALTAAGLSSRRQ